MSLAEIAETVPAPLNKLDAEPPNPRRRCRVTVVRDFLRITPVEAEVFERWLVDKNTDDSYRRSAPWISQKIELRTKIPLPPGIVRAHRRGECTCSR